MLEFIKGRQIDKRIIDKLVAVVKQARCRKYDPENTIPVLITEDNLKKALKASKLTLAALKKGSHDGSLCLLKTVEN